MGFGVGRSAPGRGPRVPGPPGFVGEMQGAEILPLDPTFEADPIGRRLECRPKKGININFI